jgi:hypothetical protein
VQSAAKGTVLPSIAISPHPLEDVDNLLALMEVRRSRGTGGRRLFPCFHCMGSIRLAGDSLMLKAGQRVDRDSRA